MKLTLINLLEKALIVILLTFILTVNADALPRQSQNSISDAVKQYVIEQNVPLKEVQISLTPVSEKKHIPQCDKPLTVKPLPGSKLIGYSKFRISCSAQKKWKINVSVQIDGKIDVLVASRPIVRGSILHKSDFQYAQRLNSQLNHGYYTSAKQLRLMEAKRNIRLGQVLTPAQLKAQKLVQRGQLITIIAKSDGLNLRVKGKALMSGQRGQTIKVKNLSSKKLIFAKVMSYGIVQVNF